jgi:hypothetical protein
MPSARARPNRIFAGDVRRLGGVVTVAPGRDRVTSEPCYRVAVEAECVPCPALFQWPQVVDRNQYIAKRTFLRRRAAAINVRL